MSNLPQLKKYTETSEVQKRMKDILDANSASFISSLISAVGNNQNLQKCAPESIMSAAFIAASLKLPIDPNLGFAYIIPYGNSAQFQLGYKGLVQLCIRSSQYKNIHVAEVYVDEIDVYDPVTGTIKFTDPKSRHDRESGTKEPCGYYARFELSSGFIKEDYKSRKEVEAHAKKYSKTFKNGSGVWKDNFDAMAKKTVLKLLLSKYGILSIEMQNAIIKDQSSDDGNYIDNESAVIEAPQSKVTDLLSGL